MASKEEQLPQLRKARGLAKANVTRKINRIRELLNNPDDLTEVTNSLNELHDVFHYFQAAQKDYHSQVCDEVELIESSQYNNAVESSVRQLERDIDTLLKRVQQNIEISYKAHQGDSIRIQPEDSISNIGSRASSRSNSLCSSTRSTRSAKAKAIAKRAALEAQSITLSHIHQLETEELALQQRKRELQLSGEIAAADAERTVYEQAEAEELREFDSIAAIDSPCARSNNPSCMPRNIVPKQTLAKPREDTRKTNEKHEYSNLVSSTPRDESFRRVVEMQDQQADALQQLVRQQQQGVMALTLPQPSMPVFSGNPVDYCDFIRSFENLIESKTTSSSARLYYLVQHTSGSVQELMRSCLSMNEDTGYPEARKLLKERYGQNYRIAAAHVQRLIEGPPIKNEDGTALQQFSVQITSCTNTLEKIGYLNKLNHSENLKRIIDRLPYGMRVKWRDTVDRIVEKEERDVTIKDVNQFVTVKARAATHPVFGKISIDKTKLPKQSQSQRQVQHGKASGFAIQSASPPPCPQCGSNHWLSRCDKFKKQSLEERQKLVREKKLCINCLSTGHFVRSCQKESFCKVEGCTNKHSTFLHPKTQQPGRDESKQDKGIPGDQRAESEKAKPPDNRANNGYVKSNPTACSSVTGLAIVPVQVKSKGSSKTVRTYAFLDSGSNTTFCTDALLKKLGTNGEKTKLSLTTMQGENAPVECSIVSLEIADLAGNCDINLPMVYSRPNLPVPKEAISKQEDVSRWPYLSGIKIQSINADVGLLIGSDVPQALQPREVKESQNGGPFATRTALGWVLNGPLGRGETNIPTANLVQANKSLDQQFREYCNLEFNDVNYDAKPTMSQNDRKALATMEESVTMENGHFQIGLPWKNHQPNFPNNKPQAEHRLQLLKKRLNHNPELLGKYREFMDNLVEKDYARKVVNKEGPLGTRWYLPHHPVFHPQKPGKVRVVFDCSAKYGNTSLNDQLLQGPDLTNSLVGVLTRFREEPIALMSDIEAMFHQVRVRPSDREALCFLWWPNGDLNSPPEEYQMNVHLFGSASSPSCANYALRKTAMDNASQFNDQTIKTVMRNFYVDDCLKSVREEEEAIVLAKNLRELLTLGGFKLTKWLSNSRRVIESLPAAERAAQVKDLDFDKAPIERALGVRWNVSSDTFGFAIVIKDRPATRRGILSTVSSVYDPLGFVAPYILSAKLILQDLCRLKLDWDDKIPEECLKRWQTWLANLPQLENLSVERCFKPATMGEVKSTQLHHFSDASQQGYGAVSYIRVEDVSGNVKCSFVMGKSRLAPIKPVTIPRMELSAAVVSTKLDKMSRNELSLPVDQSFFWTDSTCVLRYIENTDKRFQTFVANRIATIHDASSPVQWNYVDTYSNPADDASRGVAAESLQRWVEGPEFLNKTCEAWPKRPEESTTAVLDEDPEVKKSSLVCATNVSDNNNKPFVEELIGRFSSWSRLKRVFAWIQRGTKNFLMLRKSVRQNRTDFHPTTEIPPLSLEELAKAESEVLKLVQQGWFEEDFHQLQNKKFNSVRNTSSIAKLDPVIIDGLIRVGGRLHKAQIGNDARHPIILPKTHHVVNPNHLLLLRSGTTLPPGMFSKDDCSNTRRWRQVQYLANVFWRRWIREYLPSLQERQKWTKTRRNLAVNDIVLILDEKTPRSSWPLGRVLEVYANRRDDLVRSVKVKTSSTVLVRPVDKIIFLESEITPVNDK